jgi:hypothetical protein
MRRKERVRVNNAVRSTSERHYCPMGRIVVNGKDFTPIVPL